MLIQVVHEYVEMMEQGEETFEYTNYMLENGLGSAMGKLMKGRIGSRYYAKYPCHRESFNYPSFEDWKSERERKGIMTFDVEEDDDE